MPATVALVEDDAKYRAAIAHVVLAAPDLELAGIADDLAGGRALIDNTRPDVLLVDLGLPSGSGIELIRHAAQHLPHCDVMVLTVFADEHNVLASIAAGATGYLLKDALDDDLAEQIRLLHAGGSPVSPVIARQLLARLAHAAHHDAADTVQSETRLSTQEHMVLMLSSKGHTYEEIAALMGVARQTVLTYVKRSYRKLQVHSKTEAVYEARRMGLLRD